MTPRPISGAAAESGIGPEFGIVLPRRVDGAHITEADRTFERHR